MIRNLPGIEIKALDVGIDIKPLVWFQPQRLCCFSGAQRGSGSLFFLLSLMTNTLITSLSKELGEFLADGKLRDVDAMMV